MTPFIRKRFSLFVNRRLSTLINLLKIFESNDFMNSGLPLESADTLAEAAEKIVKLAGAA